MKPPFTIEQFMEIFKQYNTTVFPMQIVLYLLAGAALYFTVRKFAWSDKIIVLTLSFLWLWMGIIYHFLFFTTINKAAYLFGGLYILQSVLFLYFGIFKNEVSFQFRDDVYGMTGGVLILFAILVYPVISYFAGHVYPASPTFGLPCPTTIFTFGILLCTDKKCPAPILVVPFLWSIIGFSAALSLGMYEDLGLLIGGIITLLMILIRNKKIEKQNLIYT